MKVIGVTSFTIASGKFNTCEFTADVLFGTATSSPNAANFRATVAITLTEAETNELAELAESIVNRRINRLSEPVVPDK